MKEAIEHMMRTRFRRAGFRSRRKRNKYIWVRDTADSTSPVSPFALDMLASFRTKFGITLNLPDIVVWRIHLKIAITVTISSYTAAAGALVSVFNEDQQILVPNSLLDTYSERFLAWERLYLAEEAIASGVATNPTLYKEFDIRSHRRFQNVEETLWWQVVTTGTVTGITQISSNWSVLLKLP
jgi:hypothetical protein